MSDTLSRRGFLKLGSTVAVGASIVATGIRSTQAETEVGRATLPYPAKIVAEAKSLKKGEPAQFNYPDESSPCILLKVGERVPGGIGPDGDIVAYSTICTHQGCLVGYDVKTATIKCPCHFSIFDPARAGQVVCGQATVNLTQIVLDYNPENDTIHAIAINGLIYGRQSNIL